MQKRLAVAEDLSCFGTCSLSVALPIVSCMGLECLALPTALLSGHFAALPEVRVWDLSEQVAVILDQWERGGVTLDGILSGYLGSPAQVELVRQLVHRFRGPETIFVADPAMADRGHLYRGFTMDHVQAMTALCREADVIVPNVTEACLMTNIPYQERQDRAFLMKLLERLGTLGATAVILTGISPEEDRLGIACFDGSSTQFFLHPRIPGHFNGTGDIFASVFAAALLQGQALDQAARRAMDFTCQVIAHTAENEHHRPYGVDLAPWLHLLMTP